MKKETFECPRCGETAKLENSIMAGAYIICPSCGLKTKAYLSPVHAIKEWKELVAAEKRLKPYKMAKENKMFQLTHWLDADDPATKVFFGKLERLIKRDKTRKIVVAEHPERRGFVAMFVDDVRRRKEKLETVTNFTLRRAE